MQLSQSISVDDLKRICEKDKLATAQKMSGAAPKCEAEVKMYLHES